MSDPYKADETYYKILVPEKNSKGKGVRKGYLWVVGKDYASEVSSYTKGLGIFMVKPCGYQITKGGYSDNIRMNEKDKLLFMFQKSMSSK